MFLCTGLDKAEMAVKADLFKLGFDISPMLVNYKFLCTMAMPDGSKKGVSEIAIKMNLPPSNGSCSLSPLNETLMYNDWKFDCSYWSDPDGDGVSTYRLYGWNASNLFKCFIMLNLII